MIKTITIDTFTAFQKHDVLMSFDKGKSTHDDWKDRGTDIVLFVLELQKLGFTCVGLIGYEGTGKSFIMKTLPTGTNLWFNADGKNPTWKGGKEEYGTKTSPTKYMIIPKTYADVITVINAVKKSGQLDENPIAFLMAHIEDFKSNEGKVRQRLKTLGKLTNKMNIEDMFEMCYYTEVVMEGGKPIYKLRTQNNGSDTCRTMEGLHEELYIPNDGKTIVDAIVNYN